MNMLQSVTAVIRQYTDFSGIPGMPEFWWFALFGVVAYPALNAINLFTDQGTFDGGSSLSGEFGVAALVPTLAVTARRLRDAGRSCAEMFWLLLPIAGLIALIVHLAESHRETDAVSPLVITPTPVAA